MFTKISFETVLFYLVLLDIWKDVGCYGAETSIGIKGSLTKSRLSNPLNSIWSSEIKFGLMTLNPIIELLSFLNSISPPHQPYLFFDSTSEDTVNSLVHFYGKAGNVTVIKFVSGPDIDEDLLSLKLTLAGTVRRHIFVLCTLKNLARIFRVISSKNLESRWTWWIVLTVEKNVSVILEGILREGSQVILIEFGEKNKLKLLSSRVNTNGLVRFHDAGQLKMTTEGYRSKIHLDVFEDLEKSYSNFQGRRLTVTANNNHPFILFEKLSNGDLLPVGGFELAIIKALSEALNFTFRLIEPPDGKWGGPLPDGTVVGMIGVVARREAQFAMCEISVTGVREEVIDFTYPHYIESLTLFSRAPVEKNRSFAAFSPFTPLTWLLIAISLLLIGPIISIESWLVNLYLPTKDSVISFTDAAFNMFRSLVNQDNLFESENSPQKLTILFWYFFGFIISALYSGMLTATLIKPSFEKPINGLVDLPAAVKDGFTLVTTGDTSMEYMFKDAKSGIYADTWKLFNHKDRAKSFPRYSVDSMDQVVRDKLVIINGQLSSRYHGAKRGISQFYLGRETFAPQYYGAPCYPGAPFLPSFNKMFSYMTEGGMITKFVENEFRKMASHSIIIQESNTRAFTIKHLQAAFYVLPIGFIIAAVALIIECATICL